MEQKEQLTMTPKTIEELREWYAAHNLPPEEVTRFFIGTNYTQPRAFGIYEENGQFIVYKNKDDGSRAVRYHGPDEAYAVNELWMRLRQEIANQKGLNRERNAEAEKKANRTAIICVLIIALVGAFFLYHALTSPKQGYYYVDNDWYYYCDGWYTYDDTYDSWQHYHGDMVDDVGDYYRGESYSGSYGIENFRYSGYYHESSDSDSWSSSDSWDSGGTDFSSDW